METDRSSFQTRLRACFKITGSDRTIEPPSSLATCLAKGGSPGRLRVAEQQGFNLSVLSRGCSARTRARGAARRRRAGAGWRLFDATQVPRIELRPEPAAQRSATAPCISSPCASASVCAYISIFFAGAAAMGGAIFLRRIISPFGKTSGAS